MKEIGEKIREIRKKRGLSQEELAESSKVNLRTIQRIENNENQPHGKTLKLICETLNVNVEDILDYEKKADKNYLIILHLSVLTFLVIPIGNIILPLILWINKKDEIVGLKEIGANLLNFQIVWSILTYGLMLSFALLKIMHLEINIIVLCLFLIFYVLNIIMPIWFVIKTNREEVGTFYPNIIELVK